MYNNKMGFFDFVKRVGKSIGSGIKRVGKTIHDVGTPIVRTVRKAHNFVKSIPVIGGMVKNSGVSQAIDKGLDVADKSLNIVEKASKGDFIGAGKSAYNMVK